MEAQGTPETSSRGRLGTFRRPGASMVFLNAIWRVGNPFPYPPAPEGGATPIRDVRSSRPPAVLDSLVVDHHDSRDDREGGLPDRDAHAFILTGAFIAISSDAPLHRSRCQTRTPKLLEYLDSCFEDVPVLSKDANRARALRAKGGCCPR